MTPKKHWERPTLRSEKVQETLAQPACSFKPPGQSGPPRGGGSGRPTGPAFS
jgi:hypothetical protein